MSNAVKFEDPAIERMQLEAEDFISGISRLYSGYDECYRKFVLQLEHAINRAYDEKLDIHDLEYLAAVCIALRRETVLKHKRFV
jgi:hypothetical protein